MPSRYRAYVAIERDDYVRVYAEESPFFEHSWDLDSWIRDIGSRYESGDLPLDDAYYDDEDEGDE